MPPALSDSEQSDLDYPVTARSGGRSVTSGDDDDVNGTETPKSGRSKGRRSAPPTTQPQEEEDGEDDEEDEDEEDEDEELFVVESIKNHMIDDHGNLRYQVKWEGYESKKDLTWEPEDNLTENASDILEEYLRKMGGRDAIFEQTEKAARGKKRGRAPKEQPATKRARKNGVHPLETAPPAAKKKWTPPSGSWEDDIENIDACEEEGSGKLVVYLNWKNGHKTKHDTAVIYKKCPQKMLQFYERHVKIIREENKSLAENEG